MRGTTVKAGEIITLDGSTGEIILGVVPTVQPELSGDFAELMVWADEVRTALDALPQPQQQVIEMAYFDGYTQSEIAVALDIPLGTVKTRTSRGMHRLAALLEDTRDHV